VDAKQEVTYVLSEEKWRAVDEVSPVMFWNSIHPPPDDIFVVSAVDECIHFSFVCVAK
jgi:hypothetical protein